MEESIQILELFGGIGSPRCALRNLGIKTKAIDYVEIDENAVRSYNAMFAEDLEYKTQSVVGWNLKPDILIHGSPCQDMSIAGHQGKATAEAGRINRGKGADKGSGTRSSLMWETIHIIQNMGEWKPLYVIWENVKNVLNGYNRKNFEQYISEMGKLGYTSNYQILDARDFGLPQARERVFTVSVLNGDKFEFQDLIRTQMRNISEFLLDNDKVPPVYDVTQPSVIGTVYASKADHYAKEVLRIHEYVKYMDDTWLLFKTKEDAHRAIKALFEIYERMGITVNKKKTRIVALRRGFTFLKTKFTLSDTGKVIMRPCRKSITLERNGDTRKVVLGTRYDEVQNRINATHGNNSAIYYTVQDRDTLSEIAEKYGTTYQKIASMNGIQNPNKIYAGQKIRVK